MRKVTLEEISAGGVVYRVKRKNSEIRIQNIEFLLGKHSGYHKWVLPKGLVESGESYTDTAVREVEEEVGVKANISSLMPLKTIEYYYYAEMDFSGKTTRRVKKYQESGGKKTRVHKKVIFFLMELEEDLGQVGWEMEERKWISYEEGLELLAFETEKEVLKEAGKILSASGQNLPAGQAG